MRLLEASNAVAPFSTAAPPLLAAHRASGSVPRVERRVRPECDAPCIPRAALPAERRARVPVLASALEWADAPALAHGPAERRDWCRLRAKRPAHSAPALTRAAAASNIQRAKKAP